MSRAKTERLLNLVLCLLSTRRYLSKEAIREAVPGYPEGPEAFARAFERDKEQLRSMGVPVQTGLNSVLFDDEVGYRIPRDAYALPQISLTTHEWALLELASRAWQHSALESDAQRAMLKLRTQVQPAQPEPDADEAEQVDLQWWAGLPQMGGAGSSEMDPQVLASLAQAVTARQAVRFAYRKQGQEQAQGRHVQPWGLVARRGRWYLVGHDVDRGQRRVFRLGRLEPPVETLGQPQQYEIPAEMDLAAEVASASPATPRSSAILAVAPGVGHYFRRFARAITAGVYSVATGEPDCPPWDEVVIDYVDTAQLVGQVVGLAGQARVVEPVELIPLVVQHANQVVGV